MESEVWHLDDKNDAAVVVRQLLKDDGWMPTEGIGLSFMHFDSKQQFSIALEKRGVDNYPMLFLLDANLGHNFQYGGFEAWRDIENKLDRYGCEESNRPFIVIYTRDDQVLQLARALDHPRARPRILAFAGSQKLTNDNAAEFSEYIQRCLNDMVRQKLRELSAEQREEAVRQIETVGKTADFKTAANLGYTDKRFDQLFPRIAASFDSNLELARKEAKTKLLGKGLSFRMALSQFVRFFFSGDKLPILGRDDLRIVHEKGHSLGLSLTQTTFRQLLENWKVKEKGTKNPFGGKISHWLIQTSSPKSVDQTLARLLIFEAKVRWEADLTSPLSHLDDGWGDLIFAQKGIWKKFKEIKETSCFEQLREFVDLVKTQYDIDWSDGVTPCNALAAQLKGALEKKAEFSMLGISVDDLDIISDEINSERAKRCLGKLSKAEVTCLYKYQWYPGHSRTGASFLVDMQELPFDMDHLRHKMEKIPKIGRDGQSLSLVTDLICRVYGGVLAIFTMSSSARIAGLIFRGSSRNAASASTEVAKEIFKIWSGVNQLQKAHTYMHFGFPSL